MRFTNRSLLKMSYISKRNEFRKILMTNLGLTSTEVDTFLDMKKSTIDIPCHRVLKNCQIFQKYHVNVESLEKLHYCLKLLDYKLEHRINVLKDVGVPVINTHLLNKTVYHLNTKVSKFKEKTDIPVKQNIAANIFGGEIPKDISQLELSEELTLRQYYQKCLLYCKTRVFNLPYLDDKILLHSYMKIKSISMIAETLKVLRLDLHYDNEMIRKNPSVIVASADNIRSLLNSFTNIVEIPVVTFLRKYPYILLQDVDNIKRLLMLFQQYEIPDKYIKNYMKVFMISNEAFHKRIEILKRHPDLNMWYMHPRMLQLICQIEKTKHRVEYINIMDSLKWAHPQSFLSTAAAVDKSIQAGIVSAKHNLRHVLIKELGVDEVDLLMRHQHWKTATFVDIVQMLKYLKKHFTINEIRPNIHIVLYKQSRVKKVLADLKRQYSQSTEYSFTNSQYLALCLYMLEKNNHFTGDGVWSNEQNAKQQSLEKQNSVKKSDSNVNIVKNNLRIEDNDDIDHNDVDNVRSNNMCNINS
ncbi:mitochondrial transcription termination factor 5 [Temnothorax americanus]|uniref:mitochondrial transcription termination factor 5 n=1 Tax=Temnothorax americanus TaxID=1964332 RepID=UPI004068935D